MNNKRDNKIREMRTMMSRNMGKKANGKL